MDNLVNAGTIANNNTSSFYFDQDHANYTNSSGGTIQGAAIIFDDFDSFSNVGNVVGSSRTFRGYENTSSTFANSGTFNLTTGGMSLDDLLTVDNTGTLGVSGGDLTVGSTVGSIGTFNNSGAIVSGAGRNVTFRGGVYNHNAGASITGGDYLSFNSTTLNLNTDFTTDFVGAGLSSSTVNGPATFINSAGTSMGLAETTVNAAAVNSGMMKQEGLNVIRNNWFTNGLTNSAGAEYHVLSRNTSSNLNISSHLNVDGNLENYGTIALEGQRIYTNRITGAHLNQTNGTFTNHAGGLLESRLATANSTYNSYVRVGNLVNAGTIANNNTATFYFDRADAVYTNQGSIVANSGSIAFNDFASFENIAGATIQASGGIVYLDGDVFTNRGIMTGDGGYVFSGGAQLINEGMISPGDSPGILSVTGNGSFTSSSELLIEIGGTVQGVEYDFLNFSGSAMLDGSLAIDLINGYSPMQSDVFTFLSAGSIAGAFDNALSEVVFAGGKFDVTYNSGSVMLSNFSAVPEPGALFTFLAALGLLGFKRRRAI